MKIPKDSPSPDLAFFMVRSFIGNRMACDQRWNSRSITLSTSRSPVLTCTLGPVPITSPDTVSIIDLQYELFAISYRDRFRSLVRTTSELAASADRESAFCQCRSLFVTVWAAS